MYGNAHVYPYTYQGGYFYRNRMYKEALESWANAADAIRRYYIFCFFLTKNDLY